MIPGTAHESSTWMLMHLAFGPLIPKFPSMEIVKPAFVPKAEPLDLVADPSTQVDYIWNLYLTCCRPANRNPQVAFEKVKAISTAAMLLAAYEIAPAAWIGFSKSLWPSVCEAWNGPTYPTANWMFSASRITDQRAWFAQEAGLWCTQRARYGATSIVLAQTWGTMRDSLVRIKPETEESVGRIVEMYFPGDRYETQLALAVREHAEMQARINAAIARGVYLWE